MQLDDLLLHERLLRALLIAFLSFFVMWCDAEFPISKLYYQMLLPWTLSRDGVEYSTFKCEYGFEYLRNIPSTVQLTITALFKHTRVRVLYSKIGTHIRSGGFRNVQSVQKYTAAGVWEQSPHP